MSTNFAPDRAAIDAAFQCLEILLAHHALPTERGQDRFAHVSEFMMMHVDREGCIGFKHRDTRNYIFLIPDVDPVHGNCWQLYVPRKAEPFMRGFFDSLILDPIALTKAHEEYMSRQAHE